MPTTQPPPGGPDDRYAATTHTHRPTSLLGRRPLAVGLGIAALIVVTIILNTGALRQPRPTPPPITAMKTVVQGFLDRGHEPSSTWLGHVNAWVVNVAWADLQSAPGAAITANNGIDQAVSRAHTDAASGHPVTLKLRVFAGIHAPDWAKNIGGAPFTVTDPQSGASGTIGRFWLPAYGAAYNDLQTKLAIKYDTVPEIREVTIGRCTTIYSEPMIRNFSDAATVRALLTAGYSASADHLCQQQAVDAVQPWATTHADLSFNPYQTINADASTSIDETFTESMMTYCRTTLGSRCVLENNSIRASGSGATYATMYARMKALGAPISFQTATIARVGNLAQTLAWAVQQGANSVELPGGYEALSPSSLDQYASALTANSTGTIAPTPSPTPSPTPTPTSSPSPTPTTTPSPTPTPLTKTVFAYGPGSTNPTAVVASMPAAVGGMSWVFHWKDIEPTRGVYDWSKVDAALSAASASGRTSMVRVIGGSDSPAWVQPTATFFDTPGGPVPPHQVTIPLVWQASYVTPFTEFIAAYGARYDADPRISIVQMPGPGILGEMTLGSWTSAPNSPQTLGATDASMIAAWNTIMDAYRSAFRTTRSALDIGDPLRDGNVRPAVVTHAQTAYGGTVYVQQNGLGNGSSTSKIAQAIIAASKYTTVGWQMWSGNNNGTQLSSAFATASATHATYVEVYAHDCSNPADLSAITTWVAS